MASNNNGFSDDPRNHPEYEEPIDDEHDYYAAFSLHVHHLIPAYEDWKALTEDEKKALYKSIGI